MAGLDMEAIRTGPGRGPTSVMTVSGNQVTIAACDIGFPILSRMTVRNDHVVAALIRSATPGSGWRGMGRHTGQVMLYGPAVQHRAADDEGLRFTFAVTTAERLLERGERLGIPVRVPDRGEIHRVAGVEGTHYIVGALEALETEAVTGAVSNTRLDQVFTAIAETLALDDEPPRGRHRARRFDSGRIVDTGHDLALVLGRVPAIHELCAIMPVSERRLRQAFTTIYDMPPSEYFEALLLDEARRRLVLGIQPYVSVGSVAHGLGFDHLGRFAQRYARIHGELPSVTLRETFPDFAP